MPSRFCILGLCTLQLAWLGGCQMYEMRGLVVEGGTPAVLVLQKDDPRLDQPGLESAVIELTLDPATLSPKPVGMVMTDAEGRFTARIDEIGVGFLEYELGVMTRLQAHRPLYQTLPLPRPSRRLLIVMAPGKDMSMPKRDLIGETLRFGGEPDPRR